MEVCVYVGFIYPILWNLPQVSQSNVPLCKGFTLNPKPCRAQARRLDCTHPITVTFLEPRFHVRVLGLGFAKNNRGKGVQVSPFKEFRLWLIFFNSYIRV